MAEEFIDIRVRLQDARKFISDSREAGAAAGGIGRHAREAGAGSTIASRGVSMFRNGIMGIKNIAGGVISKIGGLTAGWRAAGKSLLAFGAGFATFEGIKSSVSMTEQLGITALRLHRNLGLPIQDAAAWGAVAKSRNIDNQKLGTSFTILSKNIEGALGGAKKQAATFGSLGISTQELTAHHKDFNWILGQVADGLGRLPGGSARAAAAQTLLGRGAQTIIPLFSRGSKGIKEQMDLAKKYGAVMGLDSVGGIKKFIEAQHESKFAMMGLQVAIGTTVIPLLTKFLFWINKVVLMMRQGKGPFKTMGDIIGVVAGAIKGFVGWLNRAPKAIQAVAGAAGLGLLALILTGPVGLGIAAVAAGATLIIKNWNKIKPIIMSVKDWFVGAFNTIKQALGLTGKDFGQFGKAVSNVAGIIWTAIKLWAAPMIWFFANFLLPLVKRVWPPIQNVIKGALKVIGGVIKIFTGIFTLDFGKMWQGIKQVFSGGIKVVLNLIRIFTAPARQLFSTLAHAVVSVIGWLWGGVKGAFRLGARIVVTVVKTLFVSPVLAVVHTLSSIVGFITGIFGKVFHFFGSLPGKVANVFKNVWSGIVSAFKGAINIVIGLWDSIPALDIGGNTIHLPDPLPNVTIPHIHIGLPKIPKLAKGGVIYSAGSAIVGDRGPELLSLPVGARVDPLPGVGRRDLPRRGLADAVPLREGAMKEHLPTVISRLYLDKKLVAEAVGEYTSDKAARR